MDHTSFGNDGAKSNSCQILVRANWTSCEHTSTVLPSEAVLIQLAKENSYRTILRSVRTIVSTVVNSSGSGAPVGTSPVFTTGLGGCGAGEPVVGISPAEAVPESTHARTSANAKCLILSLFSFELRKCQSTGKI